MTLLDAVDQWIDPSANFENFYTTVWNIESASGYGLDVWGRIVNIPRTLTLTNPQTFGFGEAGDRVGFGQGPFLGIIPISDNYTLTDPVYRSLIFAKAAYNITDGSIPAINSILVNILFPGRGTAYVTDGGNWGSPRSFGFGEAGDRAPFSIAEPLSPGAVFGFGEAGDRQPFCSGPFVDFFELPYENFRYVLSGPIFGFGEAGDRQPFGSGPFVDFLQQSFVGVGYGPFGDFLARPAANMTLTYVFLFQLQPFEVAIVESGVLPKSTGVLANWNFVAGVV